MDRMEILLKDRHPIDVILLLAAGENDAPKIGEHRFPSCVLSTVPIWHKFFASGMRDACPHCGS